MVDILDPPRPPADGAAVAPAAVAAPQAALHWRDGQLFRHGRPHQILSGSLHYFRVHPELWADRLARLVDLGLNTVDTYVPWNFHQPREQAAPSFTGWRDVDRFVGLVADHGLDLIVRPGPYICAEWSNGGLPSWLTGRDIALRSSDPAFTRPAEAWFDVLVPRLAGWQASRGGPVVAVQVENEFGSFGDDSDYLEWNREALIARGVDQLLFTADGPTDLMLDGGTIPGTLSAITLGSRPDAARELHGRRRPDEPFLVAEYWNGWFDHWGEKHHVRHVDSAVEALRSIVDDGGSVSVYMAHGGTNFGLWAGANEHDGRVQPTVTSYDSDAPIAEDGTLTAKFHAYREVLGATAPVRVTPAPRRLPPGRVALRQQVDLLTGLRRSACPVVHRARPASFEDLALDAGLALYSATPHVPHGDHRLTLTGIRDRAQVFVDDTLIATFDDPTGDVVVTGNDTTVRLDIVVESLGRINYGPHLGQRKGLLGHVLLDRRLVQGWRSAAVPLAEWDAETVNRTVERGPSPLTSAGFATAVLDVERPADGHLALPGSGKGFLWVNGFLLGRYWEVGPQRTLYCPAPLLRPGANIVTVLETEHLGDRLEVRSTPELGPPEQYVETF